YVAVNIREEEQAAGRRASTPPQGGINSGFRKVVRNAFPEHERARRLAVASSRHRRRQIALVEVERDEPNVLRRDGEHAFPHLSFGCLRIWMVDFEDGDAAQARQAVRSGVEPGTKDDELF